MTLWDVVWLIMCRFTVIILRKLLLSKIQCYNCRVKIEYLFRIFECRNLNWETMYFKTGLILSAFILLIGLSGCQSAVKRLEALDASAQQSIENQGINAGVDMNNPVYQNLTHTQKVLRQRLLLEQGWSLDAPDPGLDADGGATELATAEPMVLSLVDALQIAAQYSREFQYQKEQVFIRALALDLEQEEFRSSFSGLLSTLWSTDNSGASRRTGLTHAADAGFSHLFKSGIAFTLAAGLDLVQLLSGERVVTRGIVADASVSVPLLRGAGVAVVAEPLTQAQRDLRYALWEFERYRRTFAVDVASSYMQVLESNSQVRTAWDNYQRLIDARQRARRMAEAGRLPGIQVDQALQDELRARRSWVAAQQSSRELLDRFRIQLGLPPDAGVVLDDHELARLQHEIDIHEGRESNAYTDQLPPRELLQTAMEQRRDLRVNRGELEDAERKIKVAEDALRAEATLLGSGSAGESRALGQAEMDNARLEPDRGRYSALLSLDLPFERRAETVALRKAIISFSRQERELSTLEDEVKYQIRSAWRQMREALEAVRIQRQAVKVAQRRVASTGLFLKAGRIQMRDLLEAQDALVIADNALVAAQVEYVIAAMRLKRDVGTLTVSHAGALFLPHLHEPRKDDSV